MTHTIFVQTTLARWRAARARAAAGRCGGCSKLATAAGSGIITPWDRWYDNPADQPRLKMAGTIAKHTFWAAPARLHRWQNGGDLNSRRTDRYMHRVRALYTVKSGSRPRVQVKYIAGNPKPMWP